MRVNSFEHLKLELNDAIARDCLESVEKTEQRIKNLANSISQVKNYPWFELLAKINIYKDNLMAKLCPKVQRESKVKRTANSTQNAVSLDDDLEEFTRGLENTLSRAFSEYSHYDIRKTKDKRNKHRTKLHEHEWW